MEILEIALQYYDLGLCVIPIEHRTKRPRCQRWKKFQTARPDRATIRRWFLANKATGIAVILGDVSGGLVCRDFDDMQSYDRWAALYPDLANTLPTVETGRPGRHVYALADVAAVVRASKSGDATIFDLGDGELRAGGYCVLPPSVHPSGSPYRWLIPFSDRVPEVDLEAAGFLRSFGPATESHRDPGEDIDDRVNRGIPKENGSNRVGELRFLRTRPQKDLEEAIARSIRESLPKGPGKRHRQVFEFARALKAIPIFSDAPADKLEPYVRKWHKLALPVICTRAFEETWIDFLKAWPRVKFPKGEEPMAAILAAAIERELPPEASNYEQPELCLLIGLCRELQRATGDEPFYLACRTAGRLLGVDHTTANRWLFLLVHDGVLAEVIKGNQKTRKASRYRYLGDL